MSSPLSAPFSVFPSQTPTYTCPYKSCPRRFAHISELDRHHAVHHSSLGHSPITALNVRIPAFPSPPTSTAPSPASYYPSQEKDSYPFPPMHNLEHPNPTRPALRPHDIPTSSSSESLPAVASYPRRAHKSSPTMKTSSTSSSSSSSTTTSSSTTSSPPSSPKAFKWPSVTGTKKPTPKPKRSTSTTMRCGRHGDEWLGLSGWRFWR